jgi:hypothetical protein
MDEQRLRVVTGGAAWGRPTRGEPRWPATLAVLVASVLYLTLPERLQLPLGPPALWSLEKWLMPVLQVALLLPLSVAAPRRRPHEPRWQPDFHFPQMTTPGCAPDPWAPGFVDYLYVSFTNATAFSPTDTMPLTPAAKGLMLVQSLISLLTIALVAARAVNILS